ncbi:hypothetical protein ACWCW7_06960 [Nocardia tengchongensis]
MITPPTSRADCWAARQAEILGYSGPQAIRRAARRWESIAERRVSDGGLLAMRS